MSSLTLPSINLIMTDFHDLAGTSFEESTELGESRESVFLCMRITKTQIKLRIRFSLSRTFNSLTRNMPNVYIIASFCACAAISSLN